MIDIDLTKREKQSKLFKIFFISGGIFFIVTGLYKILITKNLVFDYTLLINSLYVLLGIMWLLNGFNILNTWMKRAIKIDDVSLNFKPSSIRKENLVLWKEIGSIEIKVNKLIISSKEKNLISIELGWIPYNDLIEIKNEIEKIAKEKNIDCKRD
ncbi:MAG: hypothetical protein IMY72_06130 [Bacteroidetes bacterium]|nr:hypothetical protein [Bacteroidota bacterium]